MNSTSVESRHAQYTVVPLTAACEAKNQDKSLTQGLNLTSTPKFSFKAPTTEDFHKGSRALTEKSESGLSSSLLASLRNLFSRRT